MLRSDRTAFLRETYLFEHLSPEMLETLADAAHIQRFEQGQVLFRQGQAALAVHVVVWGALEETVERDNEAAPVALLTFADVAGEECLQPMSGHRHASTTIALEESATLAIPIAALVEPGIDTQLHHALEHDADLRERVLLIRRAVPFSALDPSAVRHLAACVKHRMVARGERLVEQGQAGQACFLVHSGQFAVHTAADPETHLATLGPGAMIGEVSLLAGEPRRATVTALEPGEVLVLTRDDLQRAVGERGGETMLQSQVNLRMRPRRAAQVETHHRHGADEEAVLVLKHLALHRYFQLSEFGSFVWAQLDGTTKLTTITARALIRFGTFSPQPVTELVQRLLGAGFATLSDGSSVLSPSPNAQSRQARLRFDLLRGKAADLMAQKLFDRFGLLSHPVAVFSLLALGAAGLTYVVAHRPGISIPAVELWHVPVALVALAVSIGVHELAHMIAMKAHGLSVHGVGVGWNWFYPLAYVDTSDTWIGSARQRLTVVLAGPLANFALGGCSALIAAHLPEGNAGHALWVWAVVNFGTALLAMNPSGANDGAQALRIALHLPPNEPPLRLILDLFRNGFSQRSSVGKVAMLILLCALHLMLSAIFFYIILAGLLGVWLALHLGAAAAWVVAAASVLFALTLARGIADGS